MPNEADEQKMRPVCDLDLDVAHYEIFEIKFNHPKINGLKRKYYAVINILGCLNPKLCEVEMDEITKKHRIFHKVRSIAFREFYQKTPFVVGCFFSENDTNATEFNDNNCKIHFVSDKPEIALKLLEENNNVHQTSRVIHINHCSVIILLHQDIQSYQKIIFEKKIPLVIQLLKEKRMLAQSEHEQKTNLEELLSEEKSASPISKKQSASKITTKKNQKMLSMKKEMIFLYKKSIEQLKKCSNDMKGYAPRTAEKTINKTIKEVQNIDENINTKTKEVEKSYPDMTSSEDFKQCWEELKTAHQQFEQQYQSFLERQHPIEESFCYEPQGAQDTNFNADNLYYTHYRNGDISRWRCTLFQYPKRVTSIRHQTEGHDDIARNVIIQFQSDFKR